MSNRSLFILPVLLLLAAIAAGQTANIPETPPAVAPPAITYPGLSNYNMGTGERNFVRVFIPSRPTVNPADIGADNLKQTSNTCITSTRYLDGLGRPLQEVQRSAGVTSGTDLVRVHTYDAAGREAYQYLPYYTADVLSADHGRLKVTPYNQLTSVYNALYPGQQPYATTTYDQSPLNRVMMEYAPGADRAGAGRGRRYTYRSNEAVEDVRIWKIGAAGNSLPQSVDAYAPGTLQVTEAADEDGGHTTTYKDMEGRLILQKNFITDNHSVYAGWACTYYVYNDLGQLRYIIPPAAVSEAWTNGWFLSSLTGLCYRYCYDERGRLTEKQLPGTAPVYMVYDRNDRLVFSQDGNMRAGGLNNWAFTSYDALSRPLSTGIYHNPLPGSDRQALAALLAGGGSFTPSDILYYLYPVNLVNQYPTTVTNAEVYSSNYYDDYGHTPALAFNTSFNSLLTGPPATTTLPFAGNHTRGLLTGTKVRVMDPNNNNLFITTGLFYDHAGRLTQQQANNILGGESVITSQYDFQGSVISSVEHNTNPAAADPAARTIDITHLFFKNDATGIITREDQKIGALITTLSNTTYDVWGRPSLKTLGSTLKNAYRYNISGWLTGINDANLNNTASPDFFHERISYEDGFTSHLYNGNISGIQWRGAGSQSPVRFYGYTYDKLSRLNSAGFGEHAPGPATWSNIANDFAVAGITYDANGNIKTMQQRGPGTVSGRVAPVDMDVLTYQYEPATNRLTDVTDNNGGMPTSAPDFRDGNVYTSTGLHDYGYDANGNLITDRNKGILQPVTYSYLNRPEQITVDGKGAITYLYDAAGNKLRKTSLDLTTAAATVTDYAGPLIFENNKLQSVLHSEGRCRPDPVTANNWLYDYYMKDHLGNVRSVVNVSESRDLPHLYETGLEVAHAHEEGLYWSHLDEVRAQKPDNATPGDVKAALLDGNDPERRTGAAIMLRVMPGDKFTVAAESWYEGTVSNQDNVPNEEMVASLVNALSGGINFGGSPVSELPENIEQIHSAFDNPDFVNAFSQLLSAGYDPEKPAAYLNYAVFDENFRLMDNSGAIQAAGSPDSWTLNQTAGQIEIGQPGYLAVWVSNRSSTKVFYDQISLAYSTGHVIEENHYYPFGLTLSAKTTNPSEKNSYKFQGQRLEDDFGVYCYDYKYRMHDMQTGRFWQHDPLSEKYVHNSPYAFSENKVTGHVELEGLEAEAFMPAMMARMATTAATRPNSGEAAAWGTGIGIGGSLYNMAAGIGHLAQAALGGLSGVPQAAATGAALFQAAGDLAANGPQGYFTQSTAMSMQQQYGDLPGNMQTAATYAHIGTDIATAVAPFAGEFKMPAVNLGLRTGTQSAKVGIVVTEETIIRSLQGSNMQTLQGKVSLPMVQRYVKMLENGSIAPPIKVANGILVEGNHRYVAGRIFGIEPVQVPYTISPSQLSRAIPMSKTKVDLSDWGGH